MSYLFLENTDLLEAVEMENILEQNQEFKYVVKIKDTKKKLRKLKINIATSFLQLIKAL